MAQPHPRAADRDSECDLRGVYGSNTGPGRRRARSRNARSRSRGDPRRAQRPDLGAGAQEGTGVRRRNTAAPPRASSEAARSEETTHELQSLKHISYDLFTWKNKN